MVGPAAPLLHTASCYGCIICHSRCPACCPMRQGVLLRWMHREGARAHVGMSAVLSLARACCAQVLPLLPGQAHGRRRAPDQALEGRGRREGALETGARQQMPEGQQVRPPDIAYSLCCVQDADPAKPHAEQKFKPVWGPITCVHVFCRQRQICYVPSPLHAPLSLHFFAYLLIPILACEQAVG